MSATSISVVGSHCNVLGISPGQMRHAEPSLSSTIWLLSCFLICIADLPCKRSELWMYQGRKDTGHPQRLLERLLGRRTDALTDRKSTRLNSSHANISYAVFCLKKKK